jgi:hypothetical protein
LSKTSKKILNKVQQGKPLLWNIKYFLLNLCSAYREAAPTLEGLLSFFNAMQAKSPFFCSGELFSFCLPSSVPYLCSAYREAADEEARLRALNYVVTTNSKFNNHGPHWISKYLRLNLNPLSIILIIKSITIIKWSERPQTTSFINKTWVSLTFHVMGIHCMPDRH